jgi:hypothetical protein
VRQLAAVAFLALAVAPGARAEDVFLRPGRPFAGEMETRAVFPWAGGGTCNHDVAEFKVRLKAGKDLELTASVVGKGRPVYIGVYDRNGRAVAGTRLESRAQKTSLTVEEVNATAVYTVKIASEQEGPFSVTAKYEDPEADEAKELQAEIERLREALREAEQKLEQLGKGK